MHILLRSSRFLEPVPFSALLKADGNANSSINMTCTMCVGAQVVMVLKKEVMKTQNKELEKAAEYRQLLVHAIHECAANFPDIAANVIHLLMDFLGDNNSVSALDVVTSPLFQVS